MKFCLIGKKLGHSYSKIIHQKQGLDYTLIEIDKSQLSEFVSLSYDGFNVTIPYKKDIIPLLDEVDGDALKVGAVNTVVRKNGRLFGYNTDVYGMEYSLNRVGIDLFQKRVMILGTGGTSLTAKTVCERAMAKEIIFVSRSGEINYSNCYERAVDVIINTTPVGMYPDEDQSPIDLEKFSSLEGVFDCIYNPLRTKLLLQAEKMGIRRSGGLPMLVAQGLKAEEIWLGKEIPKARYEEILKVLLNEKRNIVLICMPSCGKTTVAKLLSEKTGRKVVDTDLLVFENEGKKPSEIIQEFGEEIFRQKESLAVRKASEQKGVIIATGGGAILKEENVTYLKKNGVLIYLERDLSKLIDDDRPLSKNGAISRLFEQRKPIYESVCDKKVSNDGDIEQTVKEILSV
ncbi:MAG: dephospho-CoA kinase [Clostridia bacterium]|nr:dephospho-CoA kinase [Clostridia bacterium]